MFNCNKTQLATKQFEEILKVVNTFALKENTLYNISFKMKATTMFCVCLLNEFTS